MMTFQRTAPEDNCPIQAHDREQCLGTASSVAPATTPGPLKGSSGLHSVD